MSGLLEGWDWFDNSLQNVLRANGFPALNKSQSMMVLYISAGVHRPIEIARKMRLSRQAIRHIANQLIATGLLRSTEDREDKRSRRLQFTQASDNVREFAESVIFSLERVLEQRLGAKNLAELKRILQLDWGDVLSHLSEDSVEAPARRPPRRASGHR
ncbi:MAG TPA: MarR family transcriptional regulator [Caulobacteraceae bacterium]|nr:MarR family transcriptional regulator [Caulobacteraceae bacterium]